MTTVRRRHRRRDRGMLLGVVLVLLGVVLLAGALALSSVRSDTASAGVDRLSRQLFDCAEQGLEYGKQYFSGTGLDWTTYLNYNTVCPTGSPLPCYPNGPIHQGANTPPSTITYPLTGTVTMGGSSSTVGSTTFTTAQQSLIYTVVIYDNDDDALPLGDSDGQIVVYSRCADSLPGGTGQARAVQAVLRTTVPTNIDYAGQAGFGFRNQGNQN